MILLVAAALQTPTVVPIPDGRPAFEIVLVRERTLGLETEDGTLPAHPNAAVLLPDGTIILGMHYPPAPPMLYPPTGDPRPLGREGRGPLEFQGVHSMAVRSDSVLVLDGNNGRITLIHQGAEARTWMAQSGSWTTAWLDGVLVTNNASQPRHFRPRPFYALDLESGEQTALGDSLPKRAEDFDQTHLYWLHPAGERSFWAVRWVGTYRIELWDAMGRHLMTFQRETSWFPDNDTWHQPDPDHPPNPHVMAVWPDAERPEVLWIATSVPDRRWREALGRSQRAEGQVYYPVLDQERAYDTMIEAIDLSSGVLLASRRVDWNARVTIGPGLVGAARETEDLLPYVEIWRTTLRPR